MAYYRRDEAGEWTTEALLDMALVMLQEAREEQLKSRRKDKWLSNNSTIHAIEARVASFGEALMSKELPINLHGERTICESPD